MEFKPGFHFSQYFLNLKELTEINSCLFWVVPIRLSSIIPLEDIAPLAITVLFFL